MGIGYERNAKEEEEDYSAPRGEGEETLGLSAAGMLIWMVRKSGETEDHDLDEGDTIGGRSTMSVRSTLNVGSIPT